MSDMASMEEYLESNISQMIRDIARKETELREKILAESIEENDFLVGSPILKARLEDTFKGMQVSYSPYVDENTIIMIKKAVLEPHLINWDWNNKGQKNEKY